MAEHPDKRSSTMCTKSFPAACMGCHHVGRRQFMQGCAVGLLAAVSASSTFAQSRRSKPVRVALVFLSKRGSSWPSPFFDTEAREKELLNVLGKGCPGIEFVPVAVREPADVKKATALSETVAGYLVYCLTLTWNLTSAIPTISKLGKPTIVADECLGGSGMFLVGYSAARRGGLPAVGVASTRVDDLIAVARLFAEVGPGTTAQQFAARAAKVYRGTFAKSEAMDCLEDQLKLNDIEQCVKQFRQSRFLIVGQGRSGQEQDFLGAKGIYVDFDEFNAVYKSVDQQKAAEWADRWVREADKVREASLPQIRKAGAVYLALLELLKRYGTDTVTMNCLGGFAAGKLEAYPCLGFMQLLNDGGHGVCEAMPDDTLSMLMGRILTGRPGYVSDPVLDTANNHIIYAHCMATTKVFGPGGRSNLYRIRTLHDRDPRSTCVQSFLPEGYMTTSFRTNFARKLLVVHQAKSVGNLDADRGCRTQLVGEVRGDIERLFYEWDRFGWHRVTVYGDFKEPLIEFGKALGLQPIEEA